jgi:adenylyltransferase/sulfurtransferase
MPSLRVPTPLRTYTAGQSEVSLNGGTVGELMDSLVLQYPAIQPHLFNGEGSLRPFVNLFLGEDNVRDLKGLETPIQEDDRLLLIPSIAGG